MNPGVCTSQAEAVLSLSARARTPHTSALRHRGRPTAPVPGLALHPDREESCARTCALPGCESELGKLKCCGGVSPRVDRVAVPRSSCPLLLLLRCTLLKFVRPRRGLYRVPRQVCVPAAGLVPSGSWSSLKERDRAELKCDGVTVLAVDGVSEDARECEASPVLTGTRSMFSVRLWTPQALRCRLAHERIWHR
jgi:hypothetical protein